jgi:hypothetical protein
MLYYNFLISNGKPKSIGNKHCQHLKWLIIPWPYPYTETKGYRLWDDKYRRVIISPDVIFDELANPDRSAPETFSGVFVFNLDGQAPYPHAPALAMGPSQLHADHTTPTYEGPTVLFAEYYANDHEEQFQVDVDLRASSEDTEPTRTAQHHFPRPIHVRSMPTRF